MPAKAAAQRTECLNPNTGGRMNIDKNIYDVLSKAIIQTLRGKALTYTQMVESIQTYLKKHQIKFNGSVSWYAVTIKNDMQARGKIEVVVEKGKKLHRLSK